jgi:hypothetical protein
MPPSIDLTGKCNCGRVKFHAAGEILFNLLCHCKACTRAGGVSPVHLLAITQEGFTITQGEKDLKVAKGHGKMRHAFCTECGCRIYQHPDDRGFRSLFPPTFHIEDKYGTINNGCLLLPPEMMPKAHINYESRLRNFEDDLPKFKEWPDGERLNNDGTSYKEFN